MKVGHTPWGMTSWVPGLLVLWACGGEAAKNPDPDLAPDTEGVVDIDPGDTTDTGTTDTHPDDTTARPDPEGEACPVTAGGHTRAFVDNAEPARPGALAADFDVETLAGHFHLKTRWDGCASVVVFVHFPGITDNLWRSDSTLLFTEGHPHVDYLFVSDSADPEQRITDVLVAERSIEAAIKTTFRDEADRATWRQRIHYVTGRARELEGGLGDYVRSELSHSQTPESEVDLGDRGIAPLPAPVVFGIDREQRFDAGDNLSPAVGQGETLSMAAFLPRFYAWRAVSSEQRAAETRNRFVLYDERTTARDFFVDWSPPENLMIENLDFRDDVRVPATRAYLDVEVTCDERNPFACSEWDRIASILVCTSSDCAESLELGRWITPYWRRGLQRYRLDVSHLMPLLTETRQFKVVLGPEWERPTPWHIHVSMYLAHEASHVAPRGVIPLFGSGTFEEEYGRDVTATIPSEATHIELFALISGHGQTAQDNCAEWCDHRHQVEVDGVVVPEFAHERPAIFAPRGCASQVDRGVIPGQWGNWAQQRAYWCPGLVVDWQIRDVTALVVPGREHLFSLSGTLGPSTPPRGGDIVMSSFLVWY